MTSEDFLCHFCDKSFTSKVHCRRHEKSRHEQKLVECEICSRKLESSASLKMHMKNLHNHLSTRPGRELLPCPRCLKEFKGKTKLQRHVLNVHDKIFNGKCYRCSECSALFTRRNDLKDHSFIHFPDRQTYCCLICSQQFYSRAKLKFHSFTHNPQRIKCEICLKVFARQAAVRKHHIQVHTVRTDVDVDVAWFLSIVLLNRCTVVFKNWNRNFKF